MIDWFVLLVPFAVLPLVLIFGFVGCTLNTEGTGAVPRFIYPPGLPSPIGSLLTLAATMTVTGAFGLSNSATVTLTVSPPLSSLKPKGDIVEFPINMEAIGAKEDGTASCTVTLTISGNPTTTLSLSATHSNATADFTLTVTGSGNKPADFALT